MPAASITSRTLHTAQRVRRPTDGARSLLSAPSICTQHNKHINGLTEDCLLHSGLHKACLAAVRHGTGIRLSKALVSAAGCWHAALMSSLTGQSAGEAGSLCTLGLTADVPQVCCCQSLLFEWLSEAGEMAAKLCTCLMHVSLVSAQ